MNPTILFRQSLDEEQEFEIAQQSWGSALFEFRSQIPKDSLVIGRYSVLPFYQELENELRLNNSYIINSYREHKYIADIRQWYEDISEYTPKTWFTWDRLGEGKYVVKGLTNSRKFRWNTHMFADGRENLLKVTSRLLDDTFISEQGLCVREYVPLKTYATGINGMRFTNEWRCFFIGSELLASGYYWSIYDGPRDEKINSKGFELLEVVAPIISRKTNFFVLDIAETENGEWIVIEINDGQMSGLSTIEKENFYECLRSKMKTYQP